MISMPWLIQRMSVKQPPSGATLDGQFSMDYMGSAEFEYGALPKSLKQITSNIDNYKESIFTDIRDYKGDSLSILSLSYEDANEYKCYISSMIDDTLDTKEATRLHFHCDNSTSSVHDKHADWCRKSCDVWWDIENNIFFSFGTNINLVFWALVATRDKKKAEGAKGWF